jgi:hypothetical protein
MKADDRLCGLVVRVPGYRFRGPGFDFLRHQIEELFEWKSSGSGLENRD